MMLYIFVLLASICNAVMDRTENEPEFNESIFYKKDKKFWLKSVSWEYAKQIFGFKVDAWHIAKFAMVAFFLLGAVIEAFSPVIHPIIDFVVSGLIWNAGFTKSYGYFFVRKENRGKFL